MASFESIDNCLSLIVEKFKNQQILLNDLKPLSNPNSVDGKAIAMTRLLYKNIYKSDFTASNATEIKKQINDALDKNPNLEENYNEWVNIFKQAVNTQ